MKRDMESIVMEPTRIRMIQFFFLHKTGTVAELKGYIPDVSQASLYRHLKLLEEAEVLLIVEEVKKRGAVEKRYQLNENWNNEQKNPVQMVNYFLLQLMGSFQRYFEKEDKNIEKDLYFLTTSVLYMTEEEMKEFLEKLETLIKEVLEQEPKEGRMPRQFTVASSPCENK